MFLPVDVLTLDPEEIHTYKMHNVEEAGSKKYEKHNLVAKRTGTEYRHENDVQDITAVVVVASLSEVV